MSLLETVLVAAESALTTAFSSVECEDQYSSSNISSNSSSSITNRVLAFFRPAPQQKGTGYGGTIFDSFSRGGASLFPFKSTSQNSEKTSESNTLISNTATLLEKWLPQLMLAIKETESLSIEQVVVILRDRGRNVRSAIAQLLRSASSLQTVRTHSLSYSVVLNYLSLLVTQDPLHTLLIDTPGQVHGETDESLLALLQPLVMSARTYRSLLGVATSADDATDEALEQLCLKTLLLWDQIQSAGIGTAPKCAAASSSSMLKHSVVSSYTPSAEESSLYELSLRPYCFRSVEIMRNVSQNKASYCFYSDAKHLASRGILPNSRERLTRIAREVSELQSNLPVQFGSSIFVRCDEARCDVIKALIIGPDDTPYANGCFEFDMLLPADYPSSPPSVLLVTTGGGQIRFNPNLYANGKVCLSLLGTWHGPGWDRDESTILQVLVSIQSLIFVPDPYYNEPGFESLRGTAEGNEQNEAYNATIREATLNEAIFKQMLYPSPFFEDIIEAHFSIKSSCILAQLRLWETFCRENWLVAKSGSKSIDSYIGASASFTQRAEAMIKLIGTTSKRLSKIAKTSPYVMPTETVGAL